MSLVQQTLVSAMLTKLLLLLVYFFIIFLAARILDLTASWLEAGCIATQFFDPLTLSVRKLKAILDQRGVSYNGIVEKTELADLVDASGAVTEPDSTLAAQSTDNEETSEEFTFKGASHFFEEVEDTKAGSWVVEVIPERRAPLLPRKQWNALRRRMSMFGIRTGTFKCEDDPWLCRKYQWNKPSLVLSMPKSNQPKGNVILQTYQSKPNVEQIFRWINSHLSSKLLEVRAPDSFQEKLEAELDHNYIYVVYCSTLDDPPMFLSSLSIKFTGRVKFVYFRSPPVSPRHLFKQELKRQGINEIPSLVVFTPEGRFSFGNRKGEHYDYKTMELFLKTLHPEVNDLFLVFLIITNLCCLLEGFLIHGGILRRTFRLLCMLTFYNTGLIMLCLPAVWLLQLPWLQTALDTSLKFCRSIMSTNMASVLRSDLLLCLKFKGIALLGFVTFGAAVGWIRKRYKCYFGGLDDDEDPNVDWLTRDLNYFSRMLESLSHRHPNHATMATGFEDGFEMLVRRLAVPDLWLQPLIPTDYIKHLPTWTFCCKDGQHCLPGDCLESSQPTEEDMKSCSYSKPSWIMASCDCAICLEEYKKGCMLLGLPCGHSFHQQCIGVWLVGGNTISHHCCPNCRWPAFRVKPANYPCIQA